MTGARWLPDPAAGRWLRALAITLVIACAAVTCAQGGGAGRGGAALSAHRAERRDQS